MTPHSPSSTHRHPASPARLAPVKYSLTELLAEVELEKVSGSFGQEKLQQVEIAKVFQNQTPRRRVQSS